MLNEKINLNDELLSHKYEFNVLQKVLCSSDENKKYQELLKNGERLPDGVHAYVYDSGEVSKTEFYTIHETDLTESEINEYLTYKKLSYIKTIKNCAVILTAVSAIAVILLALFMLSI